jgi:cyclophilin family peptidyl-prolyl cis-trans isomerase
MQKRPIRCNRPASMNRASTLLACSVIFVTLIFAGCGTATISPGATRPGDDSDLAVVADPDVLVQQVGVSITLAAAASGGQPPYFFRWDQNAGPEEIEIGDDAVSSIDLGALSVGGRYVFRIVVTDQTGATATDFAVLDITDSIEASAPDLVIVNDAAALTATIGDQVAGTTVRWDVTRGTATIENATSENATLIATTGETIGVRFTVSIPSGDTTSELTREFEVVSVFNLNPDVLIETTLGTMTIRLDAGAAPAHVANFLAYVDDGFYNGVLFHRVACIDNSETGECDPFVVQGGGFERVGGEIVAREATRDPVESEADNGNTNGEVYSVALALSSGNPNSGTTQFFINMDTGNDFLDDQSFTVFGRVFSGTNVVDAIAAVETTESELLGGEVSLPVEDVIIERVSRIFP